jgi:hypothetical protein
MRGAAHFWGAHASTRAGFGILPKQSFEKFAIAECDRPHATNVRSPDVRVAAGLIVVRLLQSSAEIFRCVLVEFL